MRDDGVDVIFVKVEKQHSCGLRYMLCSGVCCSLKGTCERHARYREAYDNDIANGWLRDMRHGTKRCRDYIKNNEEK